ncbi:MAG TPA: XRE family transcriptional regulator [Planctomycetota bacterium]|nr:XRE family transcriptional regulator [Planctomycetota bacterium]
MSISPIDLGRKLAEARSSAGFTQDQVAESLAVPRTAIVQMEAGRRAVSTLELAEMAKLYHRHVADFFDESQPAEEDPLVALGRISDDLRDDPTTAASIARCVQLFREGALLESELGRTKVAQPPNYATPAAAQAAAAAQGIDAAARERNRLGLGDAPIADMCRLVSEQGIWATSAVLTDGVSGLFLNHSSIGLAIVVNRDHPLPRKRFSFAHEYAHSLFDRDRVAAVTARANASDVVERRANAFAAAFLMPKGGVESMLRGMQKGGPSRRSFVSYDVANEGRQDSEERAPPGTQGLTFREVAGVASHFGASYDAACYRLRELGYVNERELAELLEQQVVGREYVELLGGGQERDAKTEDRDKELVAQLIPLVLEAYARELVSRGKVRELAGMIGLAESDVLKFANE